MSRMTRSVAMCRTVASGQVGCLFSGHFDRVRWDLHREVESEPASRLVTVDLGPWASVAELTECLVDRLAGAAAMLWPHWYGGGGDERGVAGEAVEPAGRAAGCRAVAGAERRVDRAWRRAAESACRLGRLPRSPGHSRGNELRQLRLALSGQRLVVAMFAEHSPTSDASWTGLAKVAQWLARQADAAVWVVLAESLSECRQLDAINSLSVHWPPEPIAPQPSPRRAGRPAGVHVAPILGRPHPASRGEQILAARLGEDPCLAGRFEFNQPVETVRGSRFIVDLLSRHDRVIVEVDGYHWHSTPEAFDADRERDYELILSGYLVLRLPHALVVENPPVACRRIRDFLEFRQSSSPLHSR